MSVSAVSGASQSRIPPWLTRFLPFLLWWDRVTPESLRADFIAGLTGAIVVLPQGVAFAAIAGMPLQYGLYAGMVPAVIAAFFGSSWHLVSGPTTAASLVLLSTLSAFAPPETPEYVQLALTLTFMVGVIELTMGIARMGTLVNFISHQVVLGFTAGAAILIAVNQLKNFVGLPIPRGHFSDILLYFFTHLSSINWWVTLVAMVTLLSGIASKRFFPKVPYMITAMVLGSGVSVLLNYFLGQDHTGIKTVGALPRTFPPLSHPNFSFNAIQELAPGAIAVTLFALTEAVSIGRALAVRAGQTIDGNQEFIGQGLSNLAGSFFSGYVATGSFNRSGLNYEAGARTPIAAAFAGLLLMFIVVLVAPLAAYLPNAAMAGILFLVAWGLIDFHHMGKVVKVNKSGTAAMLVTFASTLVLKLEDAIFLGVILSLALYLNKTSHAQVLRRVPDPREDKRGFVTNTDRSLPECPQFRLIRIDGSLFFGAVQHVQSEIAKMDEETPEQKHLAIVSDGINFVDVAGAEFLAQEARTRRQRGGTLYLVRVKEGVCQPLGKGGYLEEIGRENMFDGKTEAIEKIFQRLDGKVCETCTRRIFRECQELPPPQVTEA
jgi:SulP family sulfate permease